METGADDEALCGRWLAVPLRRFAPKKEDHTVEGAFFAFSVFFSRAMAPVYQARRV